MSELTARLVKIDRDLGLEGLELRAFMKEERDREDRKRKKHRKDLEKEQQSDPTLETIRAKAKNNDETYYTYNGIIFRRTNNKSDIDQIA
ncbi:hypothetical protein PoB_000274100 [Plakobranchus ocellatus]|uniref:Uncharacterized protein n=1 Tax=Plakobranchus ocellatus TaxID=259542 RepID=A0AAV3XDH9_9GAST|nr:hypothetical protein PoB_000274100 [Plakobranchus ocellatus]